MSIFKSKGFDTIIGKDTTLTGQLAFSGTTVVDGSIDGISIRQKDDKIKSSLQVNGLVQVDDVIVIDDLIITGRVTAKRIEVTGTLAIRKGCVLTADIIKYRRLVAEDGAIILGTLQHLDHDVVKAEPAQ